MHVCTYPLSRSNSSENNVHRASLDTSVFPKYRIKNGYRKIYMTERDKIAQRNALETHFFMNDVWVFLIFLSRYPHLKLGIRAK